MDRTGNVFNVCDEFILHAFKSHLLAAICTQLKLKSLDTPIVHDENLQWLETKAEVIVTQNLCPTTSTDAVYGLHQSFLHMAYLYVDLSYVFSIFVMNMENTSFVTGNGGCQDF